jgi:GcrA cell cycle regulator
MEWTEERIEDLKRWHEEGHSAAVIAATFKTTRNVVLGKIFRLGLSKPKQRPSVEQLEERRKAYHFRRMQRQISQRRKEREIKMAEIQAAALAPPDALRIPLIELRDWRSDSVNQCRFIADEPPGPNYFACGLDTEPGESYCLHCTQIIIRKPWDLSEADKLKKRAHFIKIGNASKIGRTLDMGDAA